VCARSLELKGREREGECFVWFQVDFETKKLFKLLSLSLSLSLFCSLSLSSSTYLSLFVPPFLSTLSALFFLLVLGFLYLSLSIKFSPSPQIHLLLGPRYLFYLYFNTCALYYNRATIVATIVITIS